MPGDVKDPQPTDGPAPQLGADAGRDSSVRDVSVRDGLIDLSDGGTPQHSNERTRSTDHKGSASGPAASVADNDSPVADTDVGTRDRIVQAAADVFLEKGFTGTRVVDIARRAGYTSGALYSYFDSRAELLAEAVARGSSQMLSGLLGARNQERADGSAGPSDEDPISVLQSALDQIASPIDESDQMLLDGIALAHREPIAGDRLAQTIDQFRSELAHAEEGGLGEGAADMLVVLVLGITAARALGWHDPPSEQLRSHLADCLIEASRSPVVPGS